MPLKDKKARQEYHNRYMHEVWYPKNRKKHIRFQRNRKDRLQVWLNREKDKPCKDCGGRFPPEAMDFDHLDPKKKIASLCHGVRRGWSVDRLQAEIKKCDLVCANCHRIRTARRYSSR